MDKKPEIDGSWQEMDWNVIGDAESFDALKGAQIVAIRMKNVRFEFSAEERQRLVDRIGGLLTDFADELAGLDKEQRAFFLWKMLLLGKPWVA